MAGPRWFCFCLPLGELAYRRRNIRFRRKLGNDLLDLTLGLVRRTLQDGLRIACAFAYLEANEEALDWLENSVNLGHINNPLFAEKDPFLANLRDDPRFEQLMQRVKREWEESEV